MRYLGSVALAALIIGPAMAADLPVKAPAYKAPPAAVAVYDWTGFYIGIHGGGAWSRGDGIVDPLPSPIDFNMSREVFNLRGDRALAGVHAGYNWQPVPNALFGVEADWSWTNVRASETRPARDPAGVPFPVETITMSRNLDWLASFRARLGLTFNSFLIYGTGGLALGSVAYAGSHVSGNFIWPANLRQTEVGFVVGGGGEWGLTSNLTLRGEYLYYRLNGESVTVDSIPTSPPFQLRYTWQPHDTHVARAALTYKWGSPVVARY